jgi:hypothetical protein
MTFTGNGGRPLGLPKTGGRRKGTPNRATVALQEKLSSMDFDPVLEMVEIAKDKENSVEIRLRCLTEIATYVHPKRKPADVPSDQTPVINVNTQIDPGDANGGEQSKSEA